MIIGLNLNHDASVSLHEENGEIVFAAAEERYTRIKNFWGFPREAFKEAVLLADSRPISKVVVGSHSIFKPSSAALLSYILHNVSTDYFDLANSPFPPGWFGDSTGKKSTFEKLAKFDTHATFAGFLQEEFHKLGLQTSLEFRNHHESHAMSAIIGSGFTSCLCITFDGEGDFESGSVFSYQNGKLNCLGKIPREFSLGNLYTEVTARYGFKRVRHEGKITGLAAHGKSNITTNVLSAYLSHKDGSFSKDRSLGSYNELSSEVTNHDDRNFESALIDCLANRVNEFPDLAASVQEYLESQILSFVKFWKSKTGMTNLAVAGGVFANVKLNQSLIEDTDFESVYIYPNMGDGGLAPGGVWGSLLEVGVIPDRSEGLYFGKDYEIGEGLESDQIELIVQKLFAGAIVGIFQGRSEWGPRALCHRSILASPGIQGISKTLNGRLNRTDFMPFAPITSDELAEEVYDLSRRSHPDNYKNMTATVNVKARYQEMLREVINVDGTARPQIVHSSLKDVHKILGRFFELSGIPALINTSFNTHEEPIVEHPESAIRLLRSGVVDLLVIGKEIIY